MSEGGKRNITDLACEGLQFVVRTGSFFFIAVVRERAREGTHGIIITHID